MRTTITVASTAPLTRSAWTRLSRDRRFRMGRACRPMITNASTFSTNTAVSQTEYVLMRLRAGTRRGDSRASAMPEVTMVMIGDSTTRSASSQTPDVPRDGGGGQADGDDDQGRERDDVPPEVAGRGVERRVQQGGGDEERERQIGLDLELGARGGEGQRGAGDREERGIGDPDTPRETGQDHRSEEERQSPFEEGHVRSLERPPGHGEPPARLRAAAVDGSTQRKTDGGRPVAGPPPLLRSISARA